MDVNIGDLITGEVAEITGYNGCEKSYREKLLSMGLTKGTIIIMDRVAPLGDPIDVEVRGYKLSLRKSEAEILVLRRVK